MAFIKCPNCSHDISDIATSCPNCGHPIQPQRNGNPQQEFFQPKYPPNGTPQISQIGKQSAAFAIVTLGIIIISVPASLLFAPLGLFLDCLGLLLLFIGMITGPKRGCFVMMFLVFVVLPAIALIILMVCGGFALQSAFGGL